MYHSYNPNILHSVVMLSYTTSLSNNLVIIMIILVAVGLLNVLFFDFCPILLFSIILYIIYITPMFRHFYFTVFILIFIHYFMFPTCFINDCLITIDFFVRKPIKITDCLSPHNISIRLFKKCFDFYGDELKLAVIRITTHNYSCQFGFAYF